MSRSKKKSNFVNPILYYQFQELKKLNQRITDGGNDNMLVFQIWSRNSTILPQFRGSLVEIYNGQKFVPLRIDSKLNGHKLGEFSITKKLGPLIHMLGKKKKKK